MLDEFIYGAGNMFPSGCDAELRVQRSRNRSVNIVQGNLVGNGRSDSSGTCARVRRGGVCGFSSIADISHDAARAVLEAASENAVFLDSRLNRGKAPYPVISGARVEKAWDVSDPEQKYYVEFLRALDSYITEKYPDLASRGLYARSECIEKVISTSFGTAAHTTYQRSYIYIEMSAQTPSGITVDKMEVLGGWGEFDRNFIKPEDFYDRIDQLYESVKKKSEGVYAEAGTKICVLGGDLAGMLAHEAVGHTVEADLVIGGSVAANKIGQRVASDLVSMVDYANITPYGMSPLPLYVDDEGVECTDAELIRDGILVGYMHNRDTAERFGVNPCGNARAFAYSDEPLIRMRNTAVLPGSSKLEDLIASVDDGYYLCSTNNGQADTTGEFMFGITMGYEIKHGKLGRAILDTTISGVAFEMLKTVDMVSDTITWSSSGYCGKKQAMPVSLGGPALRCRVNIGGR